MTKLSKAKKVPHDTMYLEFFLTKTVIVESLQTGAIFESAFMVDSYRGLDFDHFGIWIIVWVQRKGNPIFVQSKSYE